MKILHLEDNPNDSIFIERAVRRQGIDATFIRARSPNEFSLALETGGFDVVVVDNGVTGFTARDAIAQSKAARPNLPVIVCSGAARDADVSASFAAGASDYVLKDYSWQLAASLRRNLTTLAAPLADPDAEPATLSSSASKANMMLLVEVVQKLSLARGLDEIISIVRSAARQLTGADGATFVLRDGLHCYYVDEDAIAPLWKGQRFSLEACVSGWAMLNARSTVIPDIYLDSRIPHAAYRPTFVRSLAMVPIRSTSPIGAIGNYWARLHECTPEELMLLEALANATSVAMENVNVHLDLEKQVRERTHELQMANQELEAFSTAVSHDLRAQLRAMNAELHKESDESGTPGVSLHEESVENLRAATCRMSTLIDDMMRLSRISRAELEVQRFDIGALANKIMTRLRTSDPQRRLDIRVEVGHEVDADPGLLGVALENLLSNAWKYTSRRDISRIEFTCDVDGAGRTIYSVTDNGAGFDSRYADQLFRPFSRLHDARDFPGIGIGLATVHRIVQRHGGEIWARSDGTNGAQFMFTLGD